MFQMPIVSCFVSLEATLHFKRVGKVYAKVNGFIKRNAYRKVKVGKTAAFLRMLQRREGLELSSRDAKALIKTA